MGIISWFINQLITGGPILYRYNPPINPSKIGLICINLYIANELGHHFDWPPFPDRKMHHDTVAVDHHRVGLPDQAGANTGGGVRQIGLGAEMVNQFEWW